MIGQRCIVEPLRVGLRTVHVSSFDYVRPNLYPHT